MADLRGLKPWLRPYAEWLVAAGRSVDGRLVVTSGYRSWAKQAELYRRYLAGGSSLPALPPGASRHQYGLAWDMARIGIDPKRDGLLVSLGELWRQMGGHWAGPSDPVHFEVR